MIFKHGSPSQRREQDREKGVPTPGVAQATGAVAPREVGKRWPEVTAEKPGPAPWGTATVEGPSWNSREAPGPLCVGEERELTTEAIPPAIPNHGDTSNHAVGVSVVSAPVWKDHRGLSPFGEELRGRFSKLKLTCDPPGNFLHLPR